MSDLYRTFNGQLVVDGRRGVIYFHDESGVTILRACGVDAKDGLERLEPDDVPFIDITLGVVNYTSVQRQAP